MLFISVVSFVFRVKAKNLCLKIKEEILKKLYEFFKLIINRDAFTLVNEVSYVYLNRCSAKFYIFEQKCGVKKRRLTQNILH